MFYTNLCVKSIYVTFLFLEWGLNEILTAILFHFYMTGGKTQTKTPSIWWPVTSQLVVQPQMGRSEVLLKSWEPGPR